MPVEEKVENVSKFTFPTLPEGLGKDLLDLAKVVGVTVAEAALVSLSTNIDKVNFGVADPYVKLVVKLVVPQLRTLLQGGEVEPVVKTYGEAMLESVEKAHKEVDAEKK